MVTSPAAGAGTSRSASSKTSGPPWARMMTVRAVGMTHVLSKNGCCDHRRDAGIFKR
jgi:hypothetical protein